MGRGFNSRRREVSAGVLVWRNRAAPEFLLAHPGGPYWAKKDDGAWTIPKGLTEPGHELLTTAQREFNEETGLIVHGQFAALKPVTQTSGKTVHAFAVEADLDLAAFSSNAFEMEWPPHSGRKQSFPEINRISYFGYRQALTKIIAYQRPLIEELYERLGAT